MKDMKNVKPAYAVNLGTGMFVAGIPGQWICRKCGTVAMSVNGKPNLMGCLKAVNRMHSWARNW